MLGVGPERPIGIVIGEGPGREEAEALEPFVGATGRELDLSLAAHELPRDRLFIVNATCCMPPIGGRKEGNMRKAVNCCRPVLLRQLQRFDPNTPVLFGGKWATYALTGRDKGVMNARGFIRWNFVIPREVIVK